MKNFIIVCAGLKGGSGKSCVCANLAMHLIDQGIPVIVYDADINRPSFVIVSVSWQSILMHSHLTS